MPSESARLLGAREHLERAQLLFDLGRKQEDAKASFRLMLAAIYSCRAMTELMLEAADKQETNAGEDRRTVEERISRLVPYYALIERIRIHDFHRFGIVPPDPKSESLMFGGPMKLTAKKGIAVVTVSEQGPAISTTGGSQAHLQRPLLCRGGKFFDDETANYVELEDILDSFVAKAAAAITEFQKLL
jgi:hypothetical protein